MTTPTQPMPEQAVRAEIVGFVAAVERELGDLPADDVADLVGGLEADLTDAWAAEGTTPTQRFGSPAAYAAELRASAGLPPRVPQPRQRFSPLARVARWSDDALAGLRAKRWWPEVAERGRQLQPGWWALRAVLVAVGAAFFLGAFLGVFSLFGVGLLSACLAVPGVMLSMRWGAAGEVAEPRTRRLLTAWNLAAVVVLGWFWVLAMSAYSGGDDYVYQGDPVSIPGLSLNGEAVSNVFGFDADGEPLKDIRLFDQNGRPLIVDQGRVRYDDNGNERDVRPAYPDQGPAQWNLYPLQESSNPGDGTPIPYADPTPPYDRVAPLPADTAEPTPDPSQAKASTGSTSGTKP